MNATVLRIVTRSTLAALQHANTTGDYSVLYKLTSPALQKNADLVTFARALAPLREKRADLLPALVVDLLFVKGTGLADSGVLHSVGFANAGPVQIRFNLAFSFVGTTWLIDGMAVDVVPIPRDANAKQEQAAPPAKPVAKAPPKPAPEPPKRTPPAKPARPGEPSDPPLTTRY